MLDSMKNIFKLNIFYALIYFSQSIEEIKKKLEN